MALQTRDVNQQMQLNLPSWKFKVSSLGCLDNHPSEIEFKPLTLVCGPNNTGKTWVMYALYGFLTAHSVSRLPELEIVTDALEKDGQYSWNFGEWLQQNSKNITRAIHLATKQRLPRIFNSTQELFKDSRFDWDVSQESLVAFGIERGIDFRLVLGREGNEVLRLVKKPNDGVIQLSLFSQQFPDLKMILADAIIRHLIGLPTRRGVFLMPAERNGLHLFYRELANRRSALFHHAAKKDKDIDIGQLIQDVLRSRYAEPVAHYIDWLNELPETRKRKHGAFHELAEELKKIVGGRYDVDAEGDISFTPYKLKRGDGETPPQMDLHLTSSTVKSLFGLWVYLEYEAQPGDVMMIDEPELNLHPANQRKLARLLARLVNKGLRVVVSTHSDYLVREVNSLIMLSKPHPNRKSLMQEFHYSDDEILSKDKIAAWLFSDRRIVPMHVDETEGIAAKTFDDEIHQLNDTSDRIYYAYKEMKLKKEDGND